MRARRLAFSLLAAVLAASLAATGASSKGRPVGLTLGSKFIVTGRTGSAPGKHTRALGKVLVYGRWGKGGWHVISMTRTDESGNYRFTLTPRRRGNLTLRITPPDGHAQGYVLHVY